MIYTLTFAFYVLCYQLLIHAFIKDFQLLKRPGSLGFQYSVNEKCNVKGLRPAGHQMANNHSCIFLPGLFFLLGYVWLRD